MILNCNLLLQGISEAIVMLDADGYISYSNPATTAITGYSSEELRNNHLSIFYSGSDDDSKAEYELALALKKGKFLSEVRRSKKDGSHFWSEMLLSPLYDENKKHIGYSCIIRDVTEKKQIEIELEQQGERYRLMVEGVRDYAIFMLDAKGYIVSWNEGAKRIKGWNASEIIGKHFSTFYTAEDLESKKPERELKIAIETGKYEEEGWRVRKDGSVFWANVVITAVYNNSGTHIGFSKVTRDLTERKEAERALRDSYERYRKLAEQLKITNQELSYANEELEQFTSIVSHDLQEPIRTIKSFLKLIKIKLDHEQSHNLKNYIDKGIGAADRMKQLIQNLLHYSQLSKGEMMEETINVEDLIREAIQNVHTSVERTHAEILIEANVKTVEGDRTQLVQLIQNLLSNALKFTDSQSPKIKIRSFSENDHVKFAVTDNGIGIAEADMNRVFEIFRRLHTKIDYPGTGIGLAICKKIVDRHHGRIWPESKPGKGTTFYFTLNEEKERLVEI